MSVHDLDALHRRCCNLKVVRSVRKGDWRLRTGTELDRHEKDNWKTGGPRDINLSWSLLCRAVQRQRQRTLNLQLPTARAHYCYDDLWLVCLSVRVHQLRVSLACASAPWRFRCPDYCDDLSHRAWFDLLVSYCNFHTSRCTHGVLRHDA